MKMFPWTTREIAEIPTDGYHGVLATLGYERRSQLIPAYLRDASVKMSPGFKNQHVASFLENKQTLDAAGFDTAERTDDEFTSSIRDLVAEVDALGVPEIPRIAIDISSMSRTRIATVVEELALTESGSFIVDMLYAPAEFRPPSQVDAPILSVEPVSPFFAGWWDDLDRPLSAIIGVGYELEHASSAIDRLEPEATYVFVPYGEDDRYLGEVEIANRKLLEKSRDVRKPMPYSVSEPFSTFQKIESLVRRIRSEERVAVVPLGPKIFALCACLVCTIHHPSTQLIRVSAKERRDPVDTTADGRVCGLRVAVGDVSDADLFEAGQAVAA